MTVCVRWVNKEDAEHIWPLVEPFLESALKRWLPVYFSKDLLDGVKKNVMQLWIITDDEKEILYGAGLTEIREYPRAKLLNLFLLGAKNMDKWRDQLSAAVEMFAKAEKCEFLQIIGRSGWNKYPDAFQSAVIVNKVLS